MLEQLRHDAEVARADLAGLRTEVSTLEAELAEREGRLVSNPCSLHLHEKNRTVEALELARLKADRQGVAVREAECAALRFELGELAAEHEVEAGKVGAIRERIEAGVAEIEGALAEMEALRRAARRRMHRARECHVMAGLPEHEAPYYAVVLGRCLEWKQRLAGLNFDRWNMP